MRNLLITIYILIVLGLSATAKAEMNMMPVIDPQTSGARLFEGQVAVTLDFEGQMRFFLEVDSQEFYELESALDLGSLNGKTVSILGIELKHKSGPVLPEADLGPLQEMDSEKLAPVLVVLEINKIN